MENFILTGNAQHEWQSNKVIFCPSLNGLNLKQSDLAMVMPKINNNAGLLSIIPTAEVCFAGVLTCDPFIIFEKFCKKLLKQGYKGAVNCPSSILFEGQTTLSMSSISATAEQEYNCLAKAEKYGLKTMAFFHNLEQAKLAIKAGLCHLILHPGLSLKDRYKSEPEILDQMHDLITTIQSEFSNIEILIYAHHMNINHFSSVRFKRHGLVQYEGK